MGVLGMILMFRLLIGYVLEFSFEQADRLMWIICNSLLALALVCNRMEAA